MIKTLQSAQKILNDRRNATLDVLAMSIGGSPIIEGGVAMEEIWRDVKGYEGLYQISNRGEIRSLKRTIYYKNGIKRDVVDRILRLSNNGNGYMRIDLYKEGILKRCYIHRLVAKMFVPNPDNNPEVNHKDRNPKNNNASNLEWCTHYENMKHSISLGAFNYDHLRGDNKIDRKLSLREVKIIRTLYKTGKHTQKELASLFLVAQSNISTIIRNKSWKMRG